MRPGSFGTSASAFSEMGGAVGGGLAAAVGSVLWAPALPDPTYSAADGMTAVSIGAPASFPFPVSALGTSGWTARGLPNTVNPVGAAYDNNGTYVILGNDRYIYKSTDGINYTKTTILFTYAVTGITYFNGRWIVSATNTNICYIYTSLDLVTFTNVYQASFTSSYSVKMDACVTKVVGNRVYAIYSIQSTGSNSITPSCMSSTDGITWSSFSMPTTTYVFGLAGNSSTVTAFGYTVSNTGVVTRSTVWSATGVDGTWTAGTFTGADASGSFSTKFLAYLDGVWIGTGPGTQPYISTDGKNFSLGATGTFADVPTFITAGNGLFTVGLPSGAIKTVPSAPGTAWSTAAAWTSVSTSFTGTWNAASTYLNGTFFGFNLGTVATYYTATIIANAYTPPGLPSLKRNDNVQLLPYMKVAA